MSDALLRQRDYNAANRERQKYQDAVRRQEWRERLLHFIGGGKCKDCGNDDLRVLQFDHLSDKEANVSAFLGKNWEKALEEARKCDVVCANCHVIRTIERRPKLTEPETVWVRRSKDVCPNGHSKTEENTYRSRGKSYCRPCRTEYVRQRRAAARNAA